MIMVEAFLLGAISAASFTAGVFFLRFWKESRDIFFLAFAVFFLTEGAIRVLLIFFSKPNEGSPWIYVVRLFALVLILAAILKKNMGNSTG